MEQQSKTLRLSADRAEEIQAAGNLLKNGGLAAIPTETVYGLVANVLDGRTVAAIFAAKGRPMGSPLIVHISQFGQWAALISEIPPRAMELVNRFWPEPLTTILPKSPLIPDEVSAGQAMVTVRFPSHPVARAVIDAAGVPLAAPSANLSGSPSPTEAQYVLVDLDGKIGAVLDGGPCRVGVESTVITLVQEVSHLLRPGGITPEQFSQVLGRAEVDPAVMNPLAAGEKVLSLGMKYKHYSPKANVILVKGNLSAHSEYVNSHAGEGAFVLCYDGEQEALHVPAVVYGAKQDAAGRTRHLFDALQKLDQMDAKVVYAHSPQPKGAGLAVYSRLIRATGFEVVGLG